MKKRFNLVFFFILFSFTVFSFAIPLTSVSASENNGAEVKTNMDVNSDGGGWTIHEEISSDLLKVFNEALGNLVGVSYEPKLAATKVTRGTSYCFICVTTTIVPGSPQGFAKVLIYQGLNEKPVLVEIEKII